MKGNLTLDDLELDEYTILTHTRTLIPSIEFQIWII